jgi:hypothetical protein
MDNPGNLVSSTITGGACQRLFALVGTDMTVGKGARVIVGARSGVAVSAGVQAARRRTTDKIGLNGLVWARFIVCSFGR